MEGKPEDQEPVGDKKPDTALQGYRSLLVEAERQSQEDYDKWVMALSGGALGVSFAFVKDFVGEGCVHESWLLFSAWVCWGFSVTCVLFSFYSSQQALRKAIKQVDKEKIYEVKRLGGLSDQVTAGLNLCGGILFLLGVISMTCFVHLNLG